MRAAAGLVEVSTPDPNLPGPFAFADPARVTRILGEAGFRDVTLTPFDAKAVYGEGLTREEAIDNAVALLLRVGPLGRAIEGKDEAIYVRARAALRDIITDHASSNIIHLGGAAWIVTARNSS